MNEYLYEMELSTMDTVTEEEIMIEISNRKLHHSRKNKLKKENYLNGEESNYDLYC